MSHNAHHQHGAEFVFCVPRHINAPQQKRHKKENHQQRADKAQLFTDDGENKVVLRFGHEQVLLAAAAKAKAKAEAEAAAAAEEAPAEEAAEEAPAEA